MRLPEVTDVLIVGAGAAGLRAAIAAREAGCESVVVVGKTTVGSAHTIMAEGGMSVALGLADPSDTPDVHAADTLRAGRHLNDAALVAHLAREAPARARELADYGALFDRNSGVLVQRSGPGGGHSKSRALLAGDYIGLAITIGLLRRVRALGIMSVSDINVVELDVEAGACRGAWYLDLRVGCVGYVGARAVVLATGGAGHLYENTTNARESTGDGYRLALEAGAVLRDMEQVQFHPTAIAWPENGRGLLVTESVRGYGGRLYNAAGERFMRRYSPDRLELSFRDVVARAIAKEILEGRGEYGGVRLDISHLGQPAIERRLPNMWRQAARLGVDISKGPMHVAPAAHHFMGGVVVDPETCESKHVRRLFCCGEVMGGVHGANRLGGNSLSEAQVFGRRAGLAAAAAGDGHPAGAPTTPAPSLPSADLDLKAVVALTRELQEAMWRDVGLFRSAPRLESARETVREIGDRVDARRDISPRTATPFAPAVSAWLDTRSLVATAGAVVASALEREESRGAHFRIDFPDEGDRTTAVTVKRGTVEPARGGVHVC